MKKMFLANKWMRKKHLLSVTLDLKETGKFLWEGREKSLPSWLSRFSSFKPKVAIAEFFWEMQRKTWYSILGLDAIPLSLKNLLLICKNYNANL